ncbi:aminotransferase [Dellaglioa sp. BT-FLS60]
MEIAGFGVEEWLNVYENDATYDIAQSTISSMKMAELLTINREDSQLFYQKLDQQKMNYGWIEGSPEFKEEVSKLYQTVKPDQVLQTNGATGANQLALYALIEPGDHVISMYPSYQQLYDIPKSLGAEVDFWHISEENQWMPDIAELKKLIRPDTKMICLNNANNPTGTVIETKLMTEIVKIAKKVGAYVLVDEVYLPLDDTTDVSSIVDLYDKGISTNSLSKTYSTPGIRIGWTVANQTVTDIFRKYRDYTMICAGVFNDQMAVHILKNKDLVLARNRKIVKHNLQILTDWVDNEPAVSLVVPKAVSTSFIKFETIEDDETFCKKLLKDYGVLLVPGSRFGLSGHARLGYCAEESVLKEGLKRLSQALHE